METISAGNEQQILETKPSTIGRDRASISVHPHSTHTDEIEIQLPVQADVDSIQNDVKSQ
jgi:hypothetical protein